MMLGYSHDVHGVGFLQWGIKQQGQPGDSFMKGLREVGKTPILSHCNNGSCWEHECLAKPQIFPT